MIVVTIHAWQVGSNTSHDWLPSGGLVVCGRDKTSELVLFLSDDQAKALAEYILAGRPQHDDAK